MGKSVRKRFDLQVNAARTTVSATFNLDKTIQVIRGLLVTSSRDDLIYHRGTQRIEINGEEFFPENYESKLLMSGLNIAPHTRFYDMENIPSGNGILKVTYNDADSDVANFQPYRVSIYLLAELEK